MDLTLIQRPLLSANNVHLINDDVPVLSDVCFDLLGGRCLGLVGDTASKEVSRIVSGELWPSRGHVVHHGKLMPPPGASVATSIWVTCGLVCLLIYSAALIGMDPYSALPWLEKTAARVHWSWLAAFALAVVTFMVGVKLSVDSHHNKQISHRVLRITGKSLQNEDLGFSKSIYSIISARMPHNIPRDKRHSRISAMLKAAGLGKLDQDLPLPSAALSDTSRHVISLLRCFAACPDVLICDDILEGLDVMQQARMLHMLRRIKAELGVAILFNTGKLEQQRLIADSICYLYEGCIVEAGPAAEVLDAPRSGETEKYIANYKVSTSELVDNFATLKKDKDLASSWLPC